MPATSRVEQILSGTYTGRPLSRVEQLLMDGGAGGGSTDVSGIIQDISGLQTNVSQLTNKTNQLGEKINELETTVDSEKTKTEQLVTHALTDAPLTFGTEE